MVSNPITAAKTYIADIKEYNRLIERELLMTESLHDRIVLVSDFLKCFSAGRLEGDRKITHLQRIKNRNALGFSAAFENNVSLPYVFEVLVSEMTEKSLQNIDMPEESELEMFGEFFAELQMLEEFKNGEIEIEATDFLYPAAHLSTFLYVWDRLDNLDKSKKISLVLGEGRPMLDFWKAVNNMDDYSHLFPDRKGGGRGPRNREKAPAVNQGQNWGELTPIPIRS